MHRVGIGRRMHGDGGDSHLTARALNAKRDFSAIGDQDLAKHRVGQSIIIRSSPNSTGVAVRTTIWETLPARGALI
jgi:hypothetical protein